MWQVFAALLATPISPASDTDSMFKKDQIIFSSSFHITKLLVPSEGNHYMPNSSSEMPSIFFTIHDPKLKGGSCIYVLEDYAAYEVLEGGRDSTTDFSTDKSVYFGAKDGVYKYELHSFSAKKLGPFRDNIIQLQKANGTDKIYILTITGKIYILENNGTVRTRLKNVVCAIEFVLDTLNNIYFVECGDKMIHIIKSDGTSLNFTASVIDDFKQVKLLRPSFLMDGCIPFFGDNVLYILYANGTSDRRDLKLLKTPSAFSVDAALYLLAALDGKIYEFNVMEVLLQSILRRRSGAGSTLSNLYHHLMSVMENVHNGIFEFYDIWRERY